MLRDCNHVRRARATGRHLLAHALRLAIVLIVSAPVTAAADDDGAFQRVAPFDHVAVEVPVSWQELDAATVQQQLSATTPEGAPASAIPSARMYQHPLHPDAILTLQRRSGPAGSFPGQAQLRAMTTDEQAKRRAAMHQGMTGMFARMGCSLTQYSTERQQRGELWVFSDAVEVRCGDQELVTRSIDAPFGTWQVGMTAKYPKAVAAELEPVLTRALASFAVEVPREAAASAQTPPSSATALYWLVQVLIACVAVGFLIRMISQRGRKEPEQSQPEQPPAGS